MHADVKENVSRQGMEVFNGKCRGVGANAWPCLFIYLFFKIGSKEIQKPPSTEAQSESLQVEITLRK